jgi:hypothetical protein
MPAKPLATQKGRGMITLATHFKDKVPATAFVQEPLDLPRALNALFPTGYVDGAFEVFARPMPVTPQHGFVESRLVHSGKELPSIWEETRKADPKGEMMLMRPIAADYNLVIHPGVISIGRGHDGATAGTGCVNIPLLGKMSESWRSLASHAGVKHDSWPFFELVVEGKTIWMVQLRGGPEMPLEQDYIPQAMTIKHVVEAHGDLIEWKQACDQMAANTCAYQVNGSLGSHYGVHCIEHKIPFLTTHQPQVGDYLEPTSALPDWDVEAIRAGVVAGTMLPIHKMARGISVEYVMLCLHSGPRMRGPGAGYWLGAACVLMQRLGVAASLGEWRHAKSHGAGKTAFSGFGRDQVYEQAFPNPMRHRKLLPAAWHSFAYGSWGGSFGGKKWAACSKATFELDQTITAIMGEPSQKTAGKLVDALNKAVNQAHNNGWWMNKFIGQDAFDRAARYEHTTILNALPIVLDLLQIGERTADMELLINQWVLSRSLTSAPELNKNPEALNALLQDTPAQESQFAKKKVVNPQVAAKTIVKIQARLDYMDDTHDGPHLANLHIQYQTDVHQAYGGYGKVDINVHGLVNPTTYQQILQWKECTSMAESGTPYRVIPFETVDLKNGVFYVDLKLPNGSVFKNIKLT